MFIKGISKDSKNILTYSEILEKTSTKSLLKTPFLKLA